MGRVKDSLLHDEAMNTWWLIESKIKDASHVEELSMIVSYAINEGKKNPTLGSMNYIADHISELWNEIHNQQGV